MSDQQQQKPSLLQHVRHQIRLKHYSIRTEDAYLKIIKRFILFHRKRHPREIGADGIRRYLTHLATEGQVSASTQNQALSALLFLYREVLNVDLPFIDSIERAKRPVRVPTVLTRQEADKVVAGMRGFHYLMASLLYGSGLRLMECVRLRVKDIDFGYKQITVRDGKGEKDRRTVLPVKLIPALLRHLSQVRQTQQDDLQSGTAEFTCHTPWRESTPMPQLNGHGSGSFPLATSRRTLILG